MLLDGLGFITVLFLFWNIPLIKIKLRSWLNGFGLKFHFLYVYLCQISLRCFYFSTVSADPCGNACRPRPLSKRLVPTAATASVQGDLTSCPQLIGPGVDPWPEIGQSCCPNHSSHTRLVHECRPSHRISAAMNETVFEGRPSPQFLLFLRHSSVSGPIAVQLYFGFGEMPQFWSNNPPF